MNVMDRLFGRNKPRTSDAIAATLAVARETLTEAQARAAAATDRRTAAIASGDRSGAIAAEAERGAAGIDAEIATGEIAGLEKGLAEAVDFERAAARAATLAALVERRRVLGDRLETEYRAAAAVMAAVLSGIAELRRDCAEGGFSDREIDRLPEVDRGLRMQTEAVANVSSFLGDALASPPTVPESPNEAAFRERQARRDRERAAEAEARRQSFGVENEEGRAGHKLKDSVVAVETFEEGSVRAPWWTVR